MDMTPREVRSFQLSAEELDHIGKIESSIKDWSIRHTKASLELREMEGQTASLYEARRQFMADKCAAAGLEEKSIDQLRIDAGGVVTVLMRAPALPVEPPVESTQDH